MDIERLKELREYTSNLCFIALSKLTDKSARQNVVSYGESINALIDSEIARLSVTDEDVRKAIHSIKEHIQLHRLRNYPQLNIGHSLDLAIQALQQMRTEGCHWCRNHTDMTVDGYANGIGTDVCLDVISFCPICGKDLR